MKLLIVDDEKYIRSSLKSGYDWYSLGFDEVFDAAKVAEALEIINNNTIEVIITDIRMPKLSGIDLIKKLSLSSPNTKIIVISGYDKFEYAQIALKYGVIDYLLKPARIEDVVEAVRKAVDMVPQKLPEKYKTVLRKDFLCNLIFRRIIDMEQIRQGIEEYELEMLKTEFCTVIFTYSTKKNDKSENGISDNIMDAIAKYAEDKCKMVLFDDNHGHIVMLMTAPKSEGDTLALCNGCCEIASEKSGFCDFEGVIGRQSSDVTEISDIYSEAVRVADRFVLSGKERAIFVSDIENVKIYNIVYMAKKYVCENINKDITIQMIADMVHITPGYFSSIFRKATGESFVKYVNMQKVEKAKNLLKIVDMPISKVADEIGLDVKYFNRVFKKYTALTPSEYRRMMKERG